MKKIILAITLSALTLPAYADTTVNGKLSTLGLGVEAAFPMMESVDARLGLNTYKYNYNKATTSKGLTTNYDGKLNLESLEALADWHPWKSSFRVSGGLMYNNNKFTMTGKPSAGVINIGGTPFPAAGASLNATIDFSKVAPYLGIGWGRTPKNTGLSFTSDIGILFQGSPNSNITTTGITPSAALTTSTAQANADLKDALKSFNIYPVLSIGVGYTF